jgi:hypothetical protein
MSLNIAEVDTLLKSTADLNNELTLLKASGRTVVSQADSISEQADHLRNKLSDIRKDAETYNQEFLDRLNTSGTPGFTKLRGLTTLQDWVLFFFYIIYVIICIAITIFAVSMTRYKLYAATVVIAFSVMIGCMMTAVIIRFA